MLLMIFSSFFNCNAFLMVFVVQYIRAHENANNDIAFGGFMPKDDVSLADEKPFWTKTSANAEIEVGNNL